MPRPDIVGDLVTRTRGARGLLAGAAAAGMLSLCGCGSGTTTFKFERAKLEAKLKTQLNRSPFLVQIGPIDTVMCPATAPAAGVSINCSAAGSYGISGSITVTFDDSAGRAFHYSSMLEQADERGEASGSATLS